MGTEQSHRLLVSDLALIVNNKRACLRHRRAQRRGKRRTYCDAPRCPFRKTWVGDCPEKIKTLCSRLRTHMRDEELNIFPMLELRIGTTAILPPVDESVKKGISEMLASVREEHGILRDLISDFDIDSPEEQGLEESSQTGRLLLASLLSHVSTEEALLSNLS